MIKNLSYAILLCGLFLSAAVLAHHSAALYDFQKVATTTGVIKEIKVNNPHLHLILEVTDEKGTRNITYEGHSRNNLYRRGWRPGKLNVGDKITISYATPRDGSDGGYVAAITAQDGTQF